MHVHQPARTARIEARIGKDALEVVKRAAALEGRSLSDFVVAAAYTVACNAVEAAQSIKLSVDDQRTFVAALLNAVPLSPAMERAREAHAQIIGTANTTQAAQQVDAQGVVTRPNYDAEATE